MAQAKGTLFAYFKKTPKAEDTTPQKSKENNVLTPNNNKKSSPSGAGAAKSEFQYAVGDITWAKLEGFPWWPSIVCDDPGSEKHVRTKNKNTEVHVQFFDEPKPTRAWCKAKCVRFFTGSTSKEFERGGEFYCKSEDMRSKCLKAAFKGDKAMEMGLNKRLSLLANFSGTEDDESDKDDKGAKENDDEMEVDEHDNSKENYDEEEVSPTKKAKGTRSSGRPKKKRRRIIVESENELDDSEDEFKPDGSGSDDSVSSGDEEAEISAPSEPDSPLTNSAKRKRPVPKTSKKSEDTKPQPTKSAFTPTVGDKTKSRLSMFSAPDMPLTEEGGGAAADDRIFKHLTSECAFLRDENIKDADGNKKYIAKPDSDSGETILNPEYDPRTVYVPKTFLDNETPAHRQWWIMKSKHFDVVLFFKMGKFYEFFHMDAATGVNELGLLYMKGDYAHAGFPEKAYGRYSSTLIEKGYKVARIEQVETPDMMQERVKTMVRPTKFDKVVGREVCRITSKGTRVYSFIDGDTSTPQSAYLLSLCEKEEVETAGGRCTYGVCFVDTSVGKFYIGQFDDDRHGSRLRTLISHYTPAQVLYERGKLSEKTQSVINSNLSSVLKEALKPNIEFWDSQKVLKRLSENEYFVDENNADAGAQWPDVLTSMKDPSDSLGFTARPEHDLAVHALGGLVWFLCDSQLDLELLSMRNFELYIPIDRATENSTSVDKGSTPSFMTGRHHMVLDGVTLSNLDILVNSSTGTSEGTLIEQMDRCATPFGKRLFRQWLCSPLCNPSAIEDRLDAIEDLMTHQDVVAEATEILRKLPDLERVLAKFHTLGLAKRKDHPDGRAIFFEEVSYSKKKIEDLLSALAGFKSSETMVKKLASKCDKFKSNLLKQTVSAPTDEPKGHFPVLKEHLKFFDNSFDHKKAKEEGIIKPTEGMDPEHDEALAEVKNIEKQLDKYLEKQKDALSCRNIKYWGTGKNRFQMEIPEAACKKLSNNYELQSSKKGFKRYRTPDIEELFSRLQAAEEQRDAALRDCMRRVFAKFDKEHKTWEVAVQCIAVLDVLISLSSYSRCGDGAMCRPQFELPNENLKPFLQLVEARHPCISRTFSGGDFIPNDTSIGIKDQADSSEHNNDSSVVLVTGPNMGGKSTLMRQVGIIIVMAQMGCYVPAEQCRLTPVDRIFTRLGASDRIMAGESTFFVELSETSAILQHATEHSLVLVDELGRGTATYDGTAIACSVVQELSQRIMCRTLFSTHYHSLVGEFKHDPNVRLGHMACMVENENEEDPSQETITFLYKFVDGACPKSYGFNAARLADLPEEVIKVGTQKSKQLENTLLSLRYFKQLHHSTCDSSKVKDVQDLLKTLG